LGAQNLRQPQLVRILIDAGGDPHVKTMWGEMPLEWAVDSANIAAIQILKQLPRAKRSRAED
jgi:hypothetical protein